MNEYTENLKRLEEFYTLEDNWDECGGLHIDKGIIDFVRSILTNLPASCDVYPTPQGTVQIEYFKYPKQHLNIEFISASEVTVFELYNGVYTKDKQLFNLSLLINRINEFLNRE